jgi:hypothetical protein
MFQDTLSELALSAWVFLVKCLYELLDNTLTFYLQP